MEKHNPVHRANDPSPGLRTYEEIEGAQGRDVYFRPARYRLSDLGPVEPVVELVVEDRTVGCCLFDVSQNGVGFICPEDIPVGLHTTQQIAVLFDGNEAYRGEARVVSVREQSGLRIVGVSFSDSLMSIDDVLQLRDFRTLGGRGAQSLGVAARPWHIEGQAEFKSLVSEFALYLADAKEQFDEIESSLPWHVVHNEANCPARRALVERIQHEFVPDYVRYSDRILEEVLAASGDDWLRMKEFSRRHLHAYFMQAPFMHRSLMKPLGYPGDFEIMRFLYDFKLEGQTLFGKAVHLATITTGSGEAVRQRKNLIRERLRALVLGSGHLDRPLRVVSVAAGPAQEVFELLSTLEPPFPPIEIVLFDQDESALTFAQTRLSRLMDGRMRDCVKLVFLKDSIKRLLNDPGIFSGFGPFDMLFSCGLFDYLRPATAANLCRNFYANLAPGGVAYVGNMSPRASSRWFLEMHLDWILNYRTHDEMMEYGRMGVPEAPMEVVPDPSGFNPFLFFRKE